MNDEFQSAADVAPKQSGMSRRSVVRTGANLAWAVPAVSLVTAAPALATSHEGDDPVVPPSGDEQNVDGKTSNNGKKATFMVPMGTATRPLAPGDIVITVKTKGKPAGNGGSGYDRSPSAVARRREITYVLTVPVAAGEELPDLKVNIKAFRKKVKRVLPKRSRYFVSDATSGEIVWTGVLKP